MFPKVLTVWGVKIVHVDLFETFGTSLQNWGANVNLDVQTWAPSLQPTILAQDPFLLLSSTKRMPDQRMTHRFQAVLLVSHMSHEWL